MQDEGKSKGLSSVLENHWEKLVLGVVVAVALAYVGTRFAGGVNPAVKGINALKERVLKQKASANSSLGSPQPVAPVTTRPVEQANPPHDWVTSSRTKFQWEYVTVETPTATFLLPEVMLNPAEWTDAGVSLSWSVPPVEIPANVKPVPVKIPEATFLYKIERRKKGEDDKAWQSLVDKNGLKHGDLRFLDTRTVPKTDYEYRVTLGSNFPAWEAKNKGLFSNKVGGPVAVRTPGIWSVDFSNIQKDPDDDPEKKGKVWVTIVKQDPKYGRVEWKKIQEEGQLLGFSREGDKESSIHAVYSAKVGKTVEVDFNFGGKIDQIKVDELVLYNRKVCKMVPGPGGDLKCEGAPQVTRESYKVNEVHYTDEDGKKQVLRKPTGPGPLPDKPCPDHGGDAPPREMTSEEKAKARAEQAEKLVEDANRLWESTKISERKEAQEKYKKLLAAYADTEAVKAHLAEIEKRAKETLK